MNILNANKQNNYNFEKKLNNRIDTNTGIGISAPLKYVDKNYLKCGLAKTAKLVCCLWHTQIYQNLLIDWLSIP